MSYDQQPSIVHHRQHLLASMLFIVVIIGLLSACGSNTSTTATNPTPTATTATNPTPTIHTVYLTKQDESVYALQSSDGHIRWSKQLDKQGDTMPSLAVFENVVYVGRAHRPSIDALKASDGTLLWHANLDIQAKKISVVNVIDGIVYVSNDEGFSDNGPGDLYALRASNGSVLWHYTISGRCCRGLVITPTTIYIGELDHVDALKVSDRALLWHHQLGQGNVLVSIVVANENVYVGTAVIDNNGPPKGSVDALRTNDGMLVWHSQTNIASSVLTIANSIVYVGEVWGQRLDALRSSDGSVAWQYNDKDGGDRGIVAATIMNDNAYITSDTVGYADNGSTVDALRVKDGGSLWRYKVDQHQIWEVIAANGLIYVHGPHGIAALDGKNGSQHWFYANDKVSSLAVGP